MTEKDNLLVQEVQIEILAEIHNRLAEISKFLEIRFARSEKLRADETAFLKDFDIRKCNIESHLNEDFIPVFNLRITNDRPVGFETDKGLYYADDEEGFEDTNFRHIPLGEDETRTRPTADDDLYFLLDEEIKEIGGEA